MEPLNFYCLKWSTSSQIIQTFLSDCYKTSDLSDVTLVCDDLQTFKAHKLILSAFSPVFKAIISTISDLSTSVIYLKGIQNQEIQALIELMYLGETNVDNERLEHILDVFKNLRIDEINDWNKSALSNNHQSNSDSIIENVDKSDNGGHDADTISCNDDVRNSSDFSYQEIKELTSKVVSDDTLNETCSEKIVELIDEEEITLLDPEEIKEKAFGKGDYPCPKCDQYFPTTMALRSHLKKMHIAKTIQVYCDQCGKGFCDKRLMSEHIIRVHKGLKSVCSYCGFTSPNPRALTRHKRRKHFNEVLIK